MASFEIVSDITDIEVIASVIPFVTWNVFGNNTAMDAGVR
jgi:hypothetical protein